MQIIITRYNIIIVTNIITQHTNYSKEKYNITYLKSKHIWDLKHNVIIPKHNTSIFNYHPNLSITLIKIYITI